MSGLQLKTVHSNPPITYRFIGKDVFIKANNADNAMKLVGALEEKGATIEMGKGWIKCNVFGEKSCVNLGTEVIDLTVNTEGEIQEKLCNFFQLILKRGGYKYKVTNI